jgi:hypothetical protein
MANPLSRYYAKVYFKQNWSDQNWQHIPMVTALSTIHKCSPGISQAMLQYDYGIIKDHTTNAFASKTPLSLEDYFVKVSLADEAGNEIQPFWFGVVPQRSKIPLGGVEGGVQTFNALGLEHLLDRRTMSGAYIVNGLLNTEEQYIQWFPGFNEQEKKGTKGFDGNRSWEFAQSGSFVFSYGALTKKWNAHQAAIYLLRHYTDDKGINWDFAGDGQYEALQGLEEIWNPQDNLSLYQWLNLLIDRRRGLSFYIRPRPGDEKNVEIVVFSVVGDDVKIGTRTLPANNRKFNFTLPSTFPETHLLKPIEFKSSAMNRYDTIEVRGERMVAIATLTMKDNTLSSGWAEEDEHYYYNATEDERLGEKFTGMFTRFRVNSFWDRRIDQIIDLPCRENLNFNSNEDGTVDYDSNAKGAFWAQRQRMERNAPLISSLDYSTNPPSTLHGPVKPSDFQEYDEWMPLFAFCQLPSHIFGGGDNVYRALDRLSEHNTGLPNCHVRALDKDFGFEIVASPRHLFGRDRWPVDAKGAFTKVADHPKLFSRRVAVTCAVKLDERLRVMVNANENTYTDEKGIRHLEIVVPGAEYWRVLESTVVGIDAGKLKRIHTGHKLLKDDRDLLDGIAAFAIGWVGKARQSIEMTINRPEPSIDLGVYLTEIDASGNAEPVNTVVTEVKTDFARTGETTITTGWGDYDIMGAIVDEKKGIASKRANWEWATWG